MRSNKNYNFNIKPCLYFKLFMAFRKKSLTLGSNFLKKFYILKNFFRLVWKCQPKSG